MSSLESLRKSLEKKYGDECFQSFESRVSSVEVIPMSSPKVNAVFGGGIPKGRILELYGNESTGKSSLACYIAGEIQRTYIEDKGRYGVVAYIDSEHSFDYKHAGRLGFDVNKGLFSQPESGEKGLGMVNDLVESGEVDFIVVDSVASLTPIAEIEGDMEDIQMGSQARMMGKAMRKISPIASKNRCTILFINQTRMTMSTYGNPETTSGGKALKFQASVRVSIRRKEFIMDKSGKVLGIRSVIKGEKNKIATPKVVKDIDIYFDRGIDSYYEWIDFAITLGIIERKGSWYVIKGVSTKLQGKTEVSKYLQENQEKYEEIIAETKERMGFSC